MESGQFSALHRIKSDELWFFHAGSPLAIHSLAEDGQYRLVLLGPEQEFMTMVPAGSWFGASPLNPGSFSLVSCTVAPGFDFADFVMGERAELLTRFPQHREIIRKLTRFDEAG